MKNIPTLFDKIAAAKIPQKFTHDFLTTTIGLKSTTDRQLIPFLRTLGFLDASGTPTSAYNLLKSSEKRAGAIAAGVRNAYRPLFDSDTNAHQLVGEKLKSLVAQIAGTDADLTARIANTFLAIARLGDFESKTPEGAPEGKKAEKEEESEAPPEDKSRSQKGLRTEFHYNIQVHLPSNASEDTYLNIFNAIRKTFQ